MNKETLIKVAVIGVIILFALEPIAINLMSGRVIIKNPLESKYVQGKATLFLELTSYDRYVIFDSLNKSVINKIKGIEGVKSVTKFSDRVIVETNNAYDSYKKIKELGVSGKCDATFTIKTAIADNKKLNASNSITMNIEPIIKEGSVMKATADVIYEREDLNLVQVGNVMPVLNKKDVKLNFTVEDVKEIGYKYVIDWSDRDKAKRMGYEVNNVVMLNNTPVEKQDFVKAIGNGYILVYENITNKSLVESYYNVSEFKDTIIKSKSPLNITFAKSYEKLYEVKLKNEEYGITKKIETTKRYEKGEKVEFDVTAIFSDEYMLYITNEPEGI